MDKNQGYSILKAVMLENGRGFALGEHPTAHPAMSHGPAMMTRTASGSTNGVTMEMTVPRWNRILQTGCRTISVFITWGSGRPRLPVFTSIIRPAAVDIGTFPKPPYNKPDEIFNYDQRVPVENGSFLAWGYLTYTRPLTEKQASDYELRPAPDNPDRPRPIAEQMKNAAKLAEADRGSEAPAPQRRQPDRGDR